MNLIPLLLCAMAVLADKPPCGLWLINGGKNEEFAFSEADMTLSCKPLGKSPRQIIFNSIRFDNVFCDASGFKGKAVQFDNMKETEEVLMAESGWPLVVSCAEYCVASTGNGVNDDRIAYNVKEIQCADDTFDLFHENIHIDGNVARCDTKSWSQLFPVKSLTLNNLKPQHFECKKAAPRCTTQHSKGIKFDDISNTLTCDGGDTFWKIEFDSKLYESLRCEKHLGTYVWKYRNNIIAEASTAIVATCIEPCGIRSDANIRYDENTHNVTCSRSDSIIKAIYNTETLKMFGPVKCDKINGWSEYRIDAYEQFSDPYSLRHVDCHDYCAFSGVGIAVEKIYNPFPIRITCSDPLSGILYKSKMYRYLECGEENDEGWRSANWTHYIEVADVHDRLDLACVKYSPPRCVIPAGDGINFDVEKKTLTCDGGVAKAIKFNSKLYNFLACDEISGWAAQKRIQSGIVAEADSLLSVSCVEYCKTSGTGLKVEWENGDYYKYNSTSTYWHSIIYVASFGNVKVTCPDQALYYSGRRVDQDTVICSLSEGWRLMSGASIVPDASTEMQFECRPVQMTTTTTKKTTTTTTSPSPTTTSATTTTTITMQTSTVSTQLSTKAPSENTEAQSSVVLIAASFGGILLFIALIIAVIFVMRRSKQKPAKGSSAINITTEGRKKYLSGRSDKSTKSEIKSAPSSS